MPVDDASKMSLLWNMLNELCNIYHNVLSGYNDEKKYSQINQALIIIHEDDSIPSFPSVGGAFYYMLFPHLEELKGLIQECFDKVYEYLEHLTTIIVYNTFTYFPHVVTDMDEIIMR